MTYLESIKTIETKLSELNLKDNFGEPYIGIEAVGIVAKFHGKVWDQVENCFERGDVDLETYTGALSQLIDEFARHIHRNRIERHLSNLLKDQETA